MARFRLSPPESGPQSEALLRADQARALEEIRWGRGVLNEDELEGVATAAWRQPDVPPVAYPDPRKLARASRVSVRRVPGLCVPGLYANGVILYRPEPDRRALGFVIFHELAHALAPAHASHVDVSRLGLALMIERSEVRQLVRHYAVDGAYRVLRARHRHAPALFLRLRVERVLLAADAA